MGKTRAILSAGEIPNKTKRESLPQANTKWEIAPLKRTPF